jgi:hypothetical protein
VNDVYDPITETVAGVAHPGSLPSGHAALRLDDGRVLVAGAAWDPTDLVVLYDPQGGGSWTTAPPLAIGRWYARAALLHDGSALVVGGVTSSSPYTLASRAERFYP